MTNCSSAPRNQKYVLPTMARCRARSGRTSWTCFFRSAKILNRNLLERSAGGTREIPKLAVRPNKEHAPKIKPATASRRSEEHTSELQSHSDLVCRLLLEKKNQQD